MRIRVCRSGVSGMVYQKILHLSTCYTISQFSGIPGFSVHHCMRAAIRSCPFLSDVEQGPSRKGYDRSGVGIKPD